MAKTSEEELGALHSVLAKVMKEQLLYKEPVAEFDDEGNEVSSEERYVAPPALLAACSKFLKDNKITCTIENNKDMNALQDLLAKKQKHSRLGDPKVVAIREASGE